MLASPSFIGLHRSFWYSMNVADVHGAIFQELGHFYPYWDNQWYPAVHPRWTQMPSWSDAGFKRRIWTVSEHYKCGRLYGFDS